MEFTFALEFTFSSQRKYIPGNQKHLTLEDRIYIQNELDKGTTFKDIARFLCKNHNYI